MKKKLLIRTWWNVVWICATVCHRTAFILVTCVLDLWPGELQLTAARVSSCSHRTWFKYYCIAVTETQLTSPVIYSIYRAATPTQRVSSNIAVSLGPKSRQRYRHLVTTGETSQNRSRSQLTSFASIYRTRPDRPAVVIIGVWVRSTPCGRELRQMCLEAGLGYAFEKAFKSSDDRIRCSSDCNSTSVIIRSHNTKRELRWVIVV